MCMGLEKLREVKELGSTLNFAVAYLCDLVFARRLRPGRFCGTNVGHSS